MKEGQFYSEVEKEMQETLEKYKGHFYSYHEGYGVLLEEVDELWDEIKKKNPDKENMLMELIQICAMCKKFALTLDLFEKDSLCNTTRED